MQQIINFIKQPEESKKTIHDCIDYFFNKDTLVLNDTRLLIIPEVLPHIPFVGGYDQRILPILRNTTAIFSTPFSEDTHQYYNGLGLASNMNIITIPNVHNMTLTENLLQDKELIEKLKNQGFQKVINFSINPTVEELARLIGAQTLVNTDISERANNKLELKKFLQKKGLPVVDGVYTNEESTIREYFSKNDHYFFKDPLGVSGYGFWSNQKNSLDEILTGYAGKDIIIEKVIEKESSPSIQFCIYGDNEKKAVIFGFTDQILEGGQHYMGNKSPSKLFHNEKITEEFIRQSENIIGYLIELGYIGFGGIDFMVSTTNEVFATEVNARFTGATYPAITSFLLTDNLSTPWKYITKEGVTESIQDYINISIKEPAEYGLFPICIAPLEDHGRAQLLFIGDLDEHDL